MYSVLVLLLKIYEFLVNVSKFLRKVFLLDIFVMEIQLLPESIEI